MASVTIATCGTVTRQAGLVFHTLLASPEFAEFARILKHLTGLSMALNTPDVGATGTGVPGDTGNPVCVLIRSTTEGARRCEACDRRHHARAGSDGTAQLYTCHAGFYDVAIPLLIQGAHVATISSGQVLPERPSDDGFARLCQRLQGLDIPSSRLRRAYEQAPWMPRTRLRHVMRLLEIFAGHLCASAWRIRELEACLEHPAIQKARELIETHFRDAHLQLSDAAEAAGLTRAHFSHLFHRETGVTFTRYVQARRMSEAKVLLTDTDQSITDICFACGFNSLTHFNRVFRGGVGCSPSQFRRHETAD